MKSLEEVANSVEEQVITEDLIYDDLIKRLQECKEQNIPIDEGFFKAIFGGLGGATIGPPIMKGICKVLGIDEKGSIIENDILGTFIALCDKSEKDLTKFVNENGFLFPINNDAFEGIKKEDLTNIITRLRHTVELMSEISSTKKNYYKIVSCIINLLFFEPVEIKTNQMNESYRTHHYQYVDLLKATGGELSAKRKQQEFETGILTIENDTILPNYQIKIEDYNNEISDNKGIYKNILQVYVNTEFEENEKRKLTDVLFHSLEKCKSLDNFFSSDKILDDISDEFKNKGIGTTLIEKYFNVYKEHNLFDTVVLSPFSVEGFNYIRKKLLNLAYMSNIPIKDSYCFE